MILGVTPARGGSKGVPKKNIKDMLGKPLLAWTIESAKKSNLLDRYIVSTENREIMAVAKKYGADFLIRPKNLATDSATTLSVLKHVLAKIDADIVVILQCTSSVRDDGLIDKCIKNFKDKRADSLATGFMCNFFEWGSYDGRRQDLKNFFHDDGNIYILKADLIKKASHLKDAWGKKQERVVVSKDQNFEIDDEFDFWLNEQILLKRKNKC